MKNTLLLVVLVVLIILLVVWLLMRKKKKTSLTAETHAEEKIQTVPEPVVPTAEVKGAVNAEGSPAKFPPSALALKALAGETVLDKKGNPINPDAFRATDENGLYKTGKMPGKGHYLCSICKKAIFLDEDTDRLPPCSQCHNNRWIKQD